MKLLVTGCNGQLARCLALRGELHPEVQIHFVGRPSVNLEEVGSLASAIHDSCPDVVINTAAYTAVDQAEDEPERAQRINADAAGEAARAAEQSGAAIIQISTDYVFDGKARQPYGEESAVGPINVYGRTKLAGEEQVRAFNPRHTILRTAWVYSPFGRNFVKSMLSAARDRDRLTVVSDQFGSPTSAFDLADAILALARRWQGGGVVGLGKTYHVAGGGVTSWYGFACEVMAECRELGLPSAEVAAIGSAEWPTRAARPSWSALDSSRFADEVGFSMPLWERSLPIVVRQIVGAVPA